MKLYTIVCSYASASALVVESRKDAFGPHLSYLVVGDNEDEAKAVLFDSLMHFIDDEVEIHSIKDEQVEKSGFVRRLL